MTYKEKLKEWNSTDKYRTELDFLYSILNVKNCETILDFGCGIMTAINYFGAKGIGSFYGYDIEEYADECDKHLYDKPIKKQYDTIYLNHVIAHIEDAVQVLKALSYNLKEEGKIVIVTPNWQWMDKGYNNDTTVVRHYDMETLSLLVKEAGYEVAQLGQFGELRKEIHQHNRLSNERLFIVAKRLIV